MMTEKPAGSRSGYRAPAEVHGEELARPANVAKQSPSRIWPSLLILVAVFPLLGLVAHAAVSIAVRRSLGPGEELTTVAREVWMAEQFPTAAGFLSVVGPIQLSLLLLALVAAAFSPQRVFARLGFVRSAVPWRALPLLMLASFFIRAIGTLLVSLLFSEPSDQALAMRRAFIELQGWPAVIVLFSASVLPGLGEESVFRGFVLRGLLHRVNPWMAVTIVSVAFAAIHPGLYLAVLVFPTGVWLGIIAWRTGSLWPAIVVHAFSNVADACVERTTPDPTKLYFLQPSPLVGLVFLTGVAALVASMPILARHRPEGHPRPAS